ncbi:hypothetical protein [Spirosoma linguale]|uniref:Guanylate cyclase domain-containing protein n=1 Tax=Spirosoma linguale (strain ATCC 33905 / DSM 74 / LMG 10896 / Claus 1) TaxID=504472 RepID=D2QV10_SPILD|nr:hypothetical protein Slin_6686 [Spirosoma linguale DSM 74]
MITYKIYQFSNFEESHKEYFDSLLNVIISQNILSSNIDEIIITDDLSGEITRYCENRFRTPNITRSREFKAVAKTVDFDGIKKIFFDANYVNGLVKWTPQVFFEQLIEIYSEDIINSVFQVPRIYYPETALSEILKIFLFQWSTKIISNIIRNKLPYEKDTIHSDVKIYVNAFKRNVRKLHYRYQDDLDLQIFWIAILTEVDDLVRRSLEVKFDSGSFESLQEFSIVSQLLIELEVQTENILDQKNVDVYNIKKYILEVLKLCYIDVPSEDPMEVIVLESPKKLFKGSLVDTEPRIVAFIDILGFSAIIKEYDSDKTSNLLNELHETLELAVQVSIENIIDSKAKTDLQEYLEYRMFSDCICISLPYIEFGNDFHIQFHSIATVVKSYQLSMMQKGFFVRGGISIGSFYADKNMIFSGGLVSAYKLEQSTGHPVIAVDKIILERLSINYKENTRGLFYDELLLYPREEPEKVFLNPFDLLDNSIKYFDYLQTSLDELVETEDGTDYLGTLTKSLLDMTKSFTQPIFDFAKSQVNKESIDIIKQQILFYVDKQIEKYETLVSTYDSTDKRVGEMERILSKYIFLKSLIKWTSEKSETFLIYGFV